MSVNTVFDILKRYSAILYTLFVQVTVLHHIIPKYCSYIISVKSLVCDMNVDNRLSLLLLD